MRILAATSIGSIASVGFLFGAVVAVAAAIALFVSAVVSILRSPRLTGVGRLVWTAVVLAFPFVGSLIWFFAGRQGMPRIYRSQTA